MNEHAFKEQALRHLCSLGAYARKQWGTVISGRGVPDALLCYRGRFIAFEFKSPSLPLQDFGTLDIENLRQYPNVDFRPARLDINDGFAEPAQRQHLEAIRKAGGLAAVVNSLEMIDYVLGLA